MAATILAILLTVYSVHALAKFGFFFLRSYRNRRAALDRAYAGKTSATQTADAVLLLFAVVLTGLLGVRGASKRVVALGLRRSSAPSSPSSACSSSSWMSRALPGEGLQTRNGCLSRLEQHGG